MRFANFSGLALILFLTACDGSSSYNGAASSGSSEDSSASGAAASAVGGAIANSSANGSPSFANDENSDASSFVGVACPKLSSSAGTGPNTCSSTSTVATLTYQGCNFGGKASWTGNLAVSFAGSTTPTCGAFPIVTSDTMQRQFVASVGGAAGSGTRTSAAGTVIAVNDAISTIDSNYESDSFNGSGPSGFTFTPFNAGGGKLVTFDGSHKRTAVTILENLAATPAGASTTSWDHTIAGTVSLAETGSASNSQWVANSGTVSAGTCSGGVSVYHNKIKVLGSTCFQAVTYNTTCCTPVAGTVTTSFHTTTNSPGTAAPNNGRSESLTYTGCGTAAYTNYAGAVTSVTTANCY